MAITDDLAAGSLQSGPSPVTRMLEQTTAGRAAVMDALDRGVRVNPKAVQQLDVDAYDSSNEFVKGLRRFGYSASATTQAFFGQMAEPLAPDFAAQQKQEAIQTMQRMPQSIRPEFETFEQAKAGGLRGLGSYAASTLGEGGPSVLMNIAGGGVGGLVAKALGRSVVAGRLAGGAATMLPQEGGETALDIAQDPQAMAETTALGRTALTLGRGSVNALAESVVPQLLIAPRLMGQAARIGPGLGNAVRNTALVAGAGAVGEYGTEAAQDLTGQAAMKIARGESLGSNYDWAKANEAGIKGAIVGGGVSGVAGGVQALTSNIGAGADAATDKAKAAAPKVGDFFSRLRSISENPEQFGADMTNTTLDALAKSGELATEGRKAVGRGMESGVESLGKLKTQIDKFVINNVKPEDREWYAEQTARLGSMTAGEYQIFKQALQAETNKEFIEGATTTAAALGNKAVEGAKNVWSWTKRVYDGVDNAVRDRNAPKQSLDVKSYSAEDRQDILNRVSSVNSTLKDLISKGSINEKRQLANILLSAAENPAYFQNAEQSRIKQNILAGWKQTTGTDLQEVLTAVREGRRDAEVTSLVVGPLSKFMAARNIDPKNRGVLQTLAQKQSYEELTPVEKRLVTTLAKKDPVALQERRDWLANEAYKTPFSKLAPAQKKQIDELAGKDLSAKDRGKTYFAELVRTVDSALREAEAQNPEAGVGNTGQIIDSMVQRTPEVELAEAQGRLDGVTYDEDGNPVVAEPWDGNRSPFDRDAYRASMVNSQFARRKDTTVPVQLSSDQLNAQQLAKIFGKKVKETVREGGETYFDGLPQGHHETLSAEQLRKAVSELSKQFSDYVANSQNPESKWFGDPVGPANELNTFRNELARRESGVPAQPVGRQRTTPIRERQGKNDVVTDLTDDEVSKVDPNKPLTLSINPMSLASMVKTEGFRERFRDQVAEFREGSNADRQAAETFMSALAILNDRGIEIDPTELGLPAGEMIKIRADVDLSQLPDNLVIRQVGNQRFTLGDYKGTTKRETSLDKINERLDQFNGDFSKANNTLRTEGSALAQKINNAAYRMAREESGDKKPTAEQITAAFAKYAAQIKEQILEREASEELRAETAAIREAYVNGEMTREQVEAVANYYLNNTGKRQALAVLRELGLKPVDESFRDEQADTLLNLIDKIDQGREDFDNNMTGQAVGLSKNDEANEELRAFKSQPLERANTEAAAADLREAKRKGGKRIYSRSGSRAERMAARQKRLAKTAAEGTTTDENAADENLSRERSTNKPPVFTPQDANRMGVLFDLLTKLEADYSAYLEGKRPAIAELNKQLDQLKRQAERLTKPSNFDLWVSARKDLAGTRSDLETERRNLAAGTKESAKRIQEKIAALEQSEATEAATVEGLLNQNSGAIQKYNDAVKTNSNEQAKLRDKIASMQAAPKELAAARSEMAALQAKYAAATRTETPATPERIAAIKAENDRRARKDTTAREKRAEEAAADEKPAEVKPLSDQQKSTGNARKAIEEAKTVEELQALLPRIEVTDTLPKGIKQILSGMVQRKIETLLNKNELTIRNATATVRGWVEKYAPDMKIRVEYVTGDALGTRPGEMKQLRGGGFLIQINSDKVKGLDRMLLLAHEFGHALQYHVYDKADQATKDAIRASYERDLAEFKKNGSTIRELGRRFAGPALLQRMETSSQADTRNSGLSVVKKRDSRDGEGYTLSFNEWFANQFAKHALAENVAGNVSEREAKFWNKVIKAVKQFWNEVVSKLQPNTEFKDWINSLVAANTKEAVTENQTAAQTAAADDAREKFVKAVEKLVGKRIAVIFDETLTQGVAGTYESIDKAKERVREDRRALLDQLNKPESQREPKLTDAQLKKAIASTEAKEKRILEDKAVLGVIRVAAGMESKAGLAEHEAFHGAFAFFFTTEERRALGTAFSQGLVAKRLREYFKDQPEVLKEIAADSEEAAAYGFQVWMHDPSALQLGEKAQTLFGKLKEFLRKLFGLMTPEQRALLILNDLKSGRRAETKLSPLAKQLDKDRPWSERAQQYAKDIGGLVKGGYDMLLTGVYERLTDLENPAITKIAKKVYSATGEEGRSGMVQRTIAEVRRYQNEVARIYKGLTDAQLKELHDANIFDKEPTDPVLKDRWNQVNKLYKDLYAYQTQAGVDLNNAGIKSNYYPLTWDPEKVLKNKEAFLKMLAKYEAEFATAKKTPNEVYEGIVAYIERGEDLVNVMGQSNEPLAEHVRTRTLAFISREDRREFMSDDPIATTLRYIRQAVRQAEYVRDFGMGGAELSALEAEAKKTYGATDDQMALVKDYINAALGNKEAGMSRELKDLYGALGVYQNVRLLPFSIFSSLVDPLGIAVRSNSIGDAFNTFTYSVKNLFRDWKSEYTPDDWEKIATDWGIIERAGTTINTDALYNGITLRGTTKKINDTFFKYNLLNGWIRNNHIMAVSAAQRFFYRASEGMFKENSARYLEEVGLSKDDIVYSEQLGRILLRKDELMAAGKSEADAAAIEDRLQEATRKFVRQSLLNPTAAELPNWASNPYLAPIAHLKQFVWAFNATIINRIQHELENNNYKPLMLAAAYVPGMIAADFLKDMVSNFGDEPPYKKDWGVVDYVKSGIQRSGLTGTGAFFTDIQEDIARGGGGYESFAGPSLEQMKKGLAALSSGDGASMERWFVKALPANAVYDQVLLD